MFCNEHAKTQILINWPMMGVGLNVLCKFTNLFSIKNGHFNRSVSSEMENFIFHEESITNKEGWHSGLFKARCLQGF